MVDFARLLGVTDLSNPLTDDGIKDFEPNSVIAKVKDRWQLLGVATSMSLTNTPEVMEFDDVGGHSFVHAGLSIFEASMEIVNPTYLLMAMSGQFEIGLIQKDFGVKGMCIISNSQVEISEFVVAKIDITFMGKPVPIASLSLEQRALKFATEAHAGQVRKYDGKPYIYHPIAVAETVRTFGGTESMIAAALLHDVVEDTPVTLDEIRKEFGDKVHDLVEGLTDVSKPTDGNRSVRKQIDFEHTAKASPDTKTIKLADIIDNARSIRQHDPDFWKVYRSECGRLLEVLHDGDHRLWEIAADQLLGID